MALASATEWNRWWPFNPETHISKRLVFHLYTSCRFYVAAVLSHLQIYLVAFCIISTSILIAIRKGEHKIINKYLRGYLYHVPYNTIWFPSTDVAFLLFAFFVWVLCIMHVSPKVLINRLKVSTGVGVTAKWKQNRGTAAALLWLCYFHLLTGCTPAHFWMHFITVVLLLTHLTPILELCSSCVFWSRAERLLPLDSFCFGLPLVLSLTV